MLAGAFLLSRARSFCDNVLGALGYKRLQDLGENGSIRGAPNPAARLGRS
jgi:hypothetical protein